MWTRRAGHLAPRLRAAERAQLKLYARVACARCLSNRPPRQQTPHEQLKTLEEARAKLEETKRLLEGAAKVDSNLLDEAKISKEDMELLQRSARKVVDLFDPDSKEGRFLDAEGLRKPEHRDLAKKEPETSLGKTIRRKVTSGGPISIAKWMELCLQNPDFGYYRKKKEIITASTEDGKIWTGDFVTSPELFSGFGQCLGVWTIMTWEQLAKPARLSLVELGPGNGTMMKDILHIVRKEKRLSKGLDIHLVETSPTLRERQMDALGVRSAQSSTETVKVKQALPRLRPKRRDAGTKYRISYPGIKEGQPPPEIGGQQGDIMLPENDLARGPNPRHAEAGAAGIMYEGYKATSPSSPRAPPTTVIMPDQDQDLPIGDRFRGLPPIDVPREEEETSPRLEGKGAKLLRPGDPDPAALQMPGGQAGFDPEDPNVPFFDNDVAFREVEESRMLWRGKSETTGFEVTWHDSVDTLPKGHESIFFGHEFFDALPIQHFRYGSLGWQETMVDIDDSDKSDLNFRLVLSLVPTISASLLSRHCTAQGFKPEPGDEMEICTAGTMIAEKIGKLVAEHGGAGIFIDYGRDGMIQRSFQGMRDHKAESPMASPGEVDMTAHVDFGALKAALKGQGNGVQAWGPVDQGYFLQGCGMIPLADKLLRATKDEKERNKLWAAIKRIMDQQQMGSHFKVLGFSPSYTGRLLGFWEPEKSKGEAVIELEQEGGLKKMDKSKPDGTPTPTPGNPAKS